MPESLTHKTLKGTFWSFAERFTAQSIHFLVMIVIARLLSPKEFGLIGMLVVFIAVAQSLIDSGFSQALIRKQDRKEIDKDTIFFFNITMSIVLYALIYLSSPWVASFYEEPQLTKIMRVICLVIIIDSFGVVQRANYTIDIDFKTQTKATLISSFISGSTGIYLAIHNYGVWALVYQQLVNSFAIVLVLWIFSKWFPRIRFSWKSFRGLFGFGSKLMVSGLLDTLYRNIYQLVIGKFFSAESLGYYTNAHKFSDFPSSNLTTVLQRVTYPVLCTIQDEEKRLAEVYRKFLRLSAFIIFPLMCSLAAVSFPLIDWVLGVKWHYAAVLLIPICFQMMWYPIHSINLNILQVKGRSDLFLQLEIIKKIIGVSILICSLPFGLLTMCYSGVFSSLICLGINTYYTGKMINVGFLIQARDISGTLLLSLAMFFVVFFVTTILSENLSKIVIGLILGLAFFMATSLIFKMKELTYIKELLKT